MLNDSNNMVTVVIADDSSMTGRTGVPACLNFWVGDHFVSNLKILRKRTNVYIILLNDLLGELYDGFGLC